MTVFDYIFKFGEGLNSLWVALQTICNYSFNVGKLNFSVFSLLSGVGLLSIISLVLLKALIK